MEMRGRFGANLSSAWRLVAHSLSGRLLLLTLVYVLITEGVIFAPTIGRYHHALLQSHIEFGANRDPAADGGLRERSCPPGFAISCSSARMPTP